MAQCWTECPPLRLALLFVRNWKKIQELYRVGEEPAILDECSAHRNELLREGGWKLRDRPKFDGAAR
jgi:hypothetical protein